LGAAAYAAKAAGLAAPDQHVAIAQEIRWQLSHLSAPAEAALRLLPPLGEDSSGPSGQGCWRRVSRARPSAACRLDGEPTCALGRRATLTSDARARHE
jgi:hypothetical protein